MGNYQFSCEKDKELLTKAMNYNLWLAYGRKNLSMLEAGYKKLASSLVEVNIIPWNVVGEKTTARMKGVCDANSFTGISKIEMNGYKNAPDYKKSFILKEAIHEVTHAMQVILPNKEFVFYNGKKYLSSGGCIIEVDQRTGRPSERYGKGFEETVIDIIADIAAIEFDEEYKAQNPYMTANDMLNKLVDNSQMSSYRLVAPITKLAIAAFANEPRIDYHYFISNGDGMYDLKTIRPNGKILMANDFLYGVMYDPLHIQREYDKFMGEGAYKRLAKTIDELLQESIDFDRISKEKIKTSMIELAKFANIKSRRLFQDGTITAEENAKMCEDFNIIWNSILEKCNVVFTKSEIDRITR